MVNLEHQNIKLDKEEFTHRSTLPRLRIFFSFIKIVLTYNICKLKVYNVII